MASSASTQAWTFAGRLPWSPWFAEVRPPCTTVAKGSRLEEAPACDEADEAIGATGVFRRDE